MRFLGKDTREKNLRSYRLEVIRKEQKEHLQGEFSGIGMMRVQGGGIGFQDRAFTYSSGVGMD